MTPLETAAGSSRLAALRGLAKSRGVDLLTVLRHADNGTLRCVVERPVERRGRDVRALLAELERKR